MNRRLVATLAALLLSLAGCGAASQATPASTGSGSPSQMATPTVPDATPTPSGRQHWPFVLSACPDAEGAEPWLVVALGTSETAGWGIRTDEAYSPQEAYPAQYAEMLCRELGVPVELHSFFPSQRTNQLTPLAWWIDRVDADETLRADLAAARVVVLWAMSSHDVVPALFFGGCHGPWPDPLRPCLRNATGNIPAEMDELFGAIEGLVPDGATVLAGDAFMPPSVSNRWAAQPYFDEIKAMVDPRVSVMPLAAEHGFVFVDTEAILNGETLLEAVDPAYVQPDGLHLTGAGQRAVAQVYIDSDGLGD